MFEELGTIVSLIIITLYISVLMDGFVIFSVMVRDVADKKEYAGAVLKPPKMIFLYAAGILMLVYMFSGEVSAYIKIIELILSLLLIADAAASTIIKVKFGGKKK